MERSDNISDLWLESTEDNQLAYGRLHQLLYPKLRNYLLHMIGDEDVVDDLLQELFVKLWNQRKRIHIVSNIKGYFFRASRSMAINHFRKISAQNNKLSEYNQPDFTFSPEDIMISSEEDTDLKRRMSAALSSLPSRQREMVYLKFYQDLDYNRIAEITGIRYQSVINHVFRALGTLREEFCKIKTEKYLSNVA